MVDLKNIFQFKTNDDKGMKEAEESLSLASDMARNCLSMEQFKLFCDSYKRAEATVVDSIILYSKTFVESDKGDTTKFALTVVRLCTRLQDLRYLLNSVENGARKGIQNEKEEIKEERILK